MAIYKKSKMLPSNWSFAIFLPLAAFLFGVCYVVTSQGELSQEESKSELLTSLPHLRDQMKVELAKGMNTSDVLLHKKKQHELPRTSQNEGKIDFFS